MTFDDFIKTRNIKIKSISHKSIIKLFYPYLKSVSGNERLLPDFLEGIINVDLSEASVITACFNGVNDGSTAPYNNVDLYIKFSNGIKIFVYGKPIDCTAVLNADEYVLMISSNTNRHTIQNRHILINK